MSRHSTLYVVRSGDTLTRIARQHGISDWRQIYHAPENAEFRRRRPNPDRIFPGDELVIVRIGPRVAFEVPPPPGSAPPVVGPPRIGPPGSAPPASPPPVSGVNTDFIFALPATAAGRAGFDSTRKPTPLHPHERRPGVRPWTLAVMTRQRVVELIRHNTASPLMPRLDELDFKVAPADVINPLQFSGGNSPGAPISMTITAAKVGTATITAVHRASGTPLAEIDVDSRKRKLLDGLLPVRVQVGTTEARAPAVITAALDAAKAMYAEQAGIIIQTLPPIDHATFARRNDTVDATDLDLIWEEIKARHKPTGVRAPILFVPKLAVILGNATKPLNGVTSDRRDPVVTRLIGVSSAVQRLEDTIAHELGHLQDLDFRNEAHPGARGFRQNIMFGDDSVDRDTLYRDQILLLNTP